MENSTYPQATECKDLTIKQKMLDEYSILAKRFTSADCESFAIFEVNVLESYINNGSGTERIV